MVAVGGAAVAAGMAATILGDLTLRRALGPSSLVPGIGGDVTEGSTGLRVILLGSPEDWRRRAEQEESKEKDRGKARFKERGRDMKSRGEGNGKERDQRKKQHKEQEEREGGNGGGSAAVMRAAEKGELLVRSECHKLMVMMEGS